MKKASNEETNLNENKKASNTIPTELLPIKEFISLSKIRLNKYQSSFNFLYFRYLGCNIYQALSYIYLEEILKFAKIGFIASFIEKLKCEETSLFKNPLFLSKMQKKTLDMQELYKKSEDLFIEIFEKYLDSLLTAEKTNRVLLFYDFYWHCMNSEGIRRFCSILLRKLVSYFSYEHADVCQKLLNSSNMKILDLEEENFSKDDLKIISFSINFRIDVFQAIKDAEMKQEMFQVLDKKEAFGRLTLIIYENEFFNFYNKSEKPELQEEIKRLNAETMRLSEENRKDRIRNFFLDEVENEEKSHGNDKMEIENNQIIEKALYKEEKVEDLGQKMDIFIEIEEEEKMEKIRERSDQKERKKDKDNSFGEKPIEIKINYNELKKRLENSENIKESNKLIDYPFENSKKIKRNDDKSNLSPPSSSSNPNGKEIIKSNENSSEKPLDSSKKNQGIKEICNKCNKNMHEKPLFTLSSCGHKICFNCMMKEYYSYAGELNYEQMCPYSPQCRKKINISEIENYFHRISLLESQSDNSSIIEEKIDKKNEKNVVIKDSEKIEKYFEENPILNEKKEKNPAKNKNNEKNSTSQHENNQDDINDDTIILESSSPLIIPESEPNPLTNPNLDQNSQNNNLQIESSPEKNPEKNPHILNNSEKEPNPQNETNPINNDINQKNELNTVSYFMEPKINCVICLKPTAQNRVFSNPACLHCYCHECVVAKFENLKDYRYCLEKNCTKTIMKKSLENYLLESKELKENIGEDKQKTMHQICYNCNKETKIAMSHFNEIDIFRCNFCYKTSCLLHKAPLVNCYCFCESCNIKTESDLIHPTKKICVNCRKKYCNFCRNTLVKCRCYCKKCDEILNNFEENNEMQNEDLKFIENFCENCRRNCDICGNILLANKKIANEKCGHVFCRECMFEFLDLFRKTHCAVKHNYY